MREKDSLRNAGAPAPVLPPRPFPFPPARNLLVLRLGSASRRFYSERALRASSARVPPRTPHRRSVLVLVRAAPLHRGVLHAEITRRDYYGRYAAPLDKIIIGHVLNFLPGLP